MSGLREIRIVIITKFLFLSTLFYCEINCNQHGLYLRNNKVRHIMTYSAISLFSTYLERARRDLAACVCVRVWVGGVGGLQITIAFFRSGLQLLTCMYVLFSVLCRKK